MSAHGTISLWIADRSAKYEPATAKSSRSPLAPGPNNCPAGFRHLLHDPDASQQFTIDGVPFDPKSSQQRDRAAKLTTMLSEIMKVEPSPGFNRDIPSGYTYFLQLIAHDLVESSLFLSRNQDSVIGLSNVRTKPLRLETIFGGGPIECPHAYDVNDCGFRDRLRLGQVRADDQTYSTNTGDFRDIARARATDLLTESSYPEALIGDARNDSHAIVSQVVVMFHHLQRQVLAKINANGSIPPTGSAIVDAQRNFVATQSACALIFRSIIRNDILPKILHPAVRAVYESSTAAIVDPPLGLNSGLWLVPLEFSFGFFRFGHSMIRSKYAFNSKADEPYGRLGITDILAHNSEQSPHQMPFEDKWTIDWQKFFGNDATKTNFSEMIGPWSRIELENAVRGPDPREPGLTARDLTSSISIQPWSVRALAQALSKKHANLLALSPYLAGDLSNPQNPPWLGAVRDWLEPRRNQPCGGLDDKDIATLAADPPIPFFARFEAGIDPAIGGKHLGVLTSIVVADVIYGVFNNDQILGVDGSLQLADQLQEVSKLAFDGMTSAFADVKSITTVGSLIDFLGALIQSPAGG